MLYRSVGGAGAGAAAAGAAHRSDTYTHRSRHFNVFFNFYLCFMPCSCTILLIGIEFCWWWISFNTLTKNV